MAKLYFYYGPMGSMKSAKAIITRFNYEENSIRTLALTSSLDTRFAKSAIASRIAGLSCPATSIDAQSDVLQIFEQEHAAHKVGVVICDEVQFFTPAQVQDLARIVDYADIDVLCYGLRTDFRLNLFPGSAALMALADVIREEVAMCACGKKATVNARLVEDKVVSTGAQIQVGGNESYKPMCRRCWRSAVGVQLHVEK